jgi:phosphoglucomutase
MHGVGTPFAKKSFEMFGLKPFIPVSRQVEPDPDFPTVAFPNPEEGKGALVSAIAGTCIQNIKYLL